MLKKGYKGYIGNLPDIFSNNTLSFSLLNIIWAVTLPILVIIAYRFNDNFVNLLSILIGLSFSLFFIQDKKIQNGLDNNNFIKISNKETYWYIILNKAFLYVVIPLTTVFILMPIILMPISLLLKDSKPQHLEKIANSNIIQNIFASIQAGAEELWRFALITMFVIILKIIFKKAWKNNSARWVILFIALLGSSFVFGWIHTFAYTQQWFSLDITILLGTSGFICGLILILTRRLSVVILAHILWDIINTLARSEFDFLIPIILYITAISIILCIVIFLGIKYKEKNIIASLY